MNRHSFLKPLLIFLLSCSFISANAQSFYEIKFSDKSNNQYKCLLVYFHENNSYLRTGYYENNIYNVVEVNYKMEYGVATGGRKYCMMKTTNPVFITTKNPNQVYLDQLLSLVL